MKKITLTLVSSVVLLLSACTSEEKMKEQEILLGAQTRSDSSPTGLINLQGGDQVGAYIVSNDGQSTNASLKPSGNLFDNLLLSYQSGVLKPQGQVYYPAGISHVGYYAYAPYEANATISQNLTMTFVVQRNQSTAGALKQSDLLWSKLLNVTTTPAESSLPSLTFGHCLSKLIFKIISGVGVTFNTPGLKVTGTKIGTNLNIAEGTLSEASGRAEEILPLTSENNAERTAEFTAITVPQTVTKGTKLFSVTNNGKTYEYTMNDSKTFESGKKYTYEITINANDLEVKVNGSITDWNDGGTVTENMPLPPSS